MTKNDFVVKLGRLLLKIMEYRDSLKGLQRYNGETTRTVIGQLVFSLASF